MTVLLGQPLANTHENPGKRGRLDINIGLKIQAQDCQKTWLTRRKRGKKSVRKASAEARNRKKSQYPEGGGEGRVKGTEGVE